jgi:hypothetical protein
MSEAKKLKLRIEREDCEDGEIKYHLWSDEPEVLWICCISDWENPNAKMQADIIVKAVNEAAARQKEGTQ